MPVKVKKPSQAEINQTFINFLSTKPVNSVVSWEGVMEHFNSNLPIPKGGWLAVRNVLQVIIDLGYLVRTNNVYVEEYTLIKK